MNRYSINSTAKCQQKFNTKINERETCGWVQLVFELLLFAVIPLPPSLPLVPPIS